MIDSCGTVHFIWLYQGRQSSFANLIFKVDISLAVNHDHDFITGHDQFNFNQMD